MKPGIFQGKVIIVENGKLLLAIGLGLAVTHKIITDHQETIDAESTPGQGSTFTIKLLRL